MYHKMYVDYIKFKFKELRQNPKRNMPPLEAFKQWKYMIIFVF